MCFTNSNSKVSQGAHYKGSKRITSIQFIIILLMLVLALLAHLEIKLKPIFHEPEAQVPMNYCCCHFPCEGRQNKLTCTQFSNLLLHPHPPVLRLCFVNEKNMTCHIEEERSSRHHTCQSMFDHHRHLIAPHDLFICLLLWNLILATLSLCITIGEISISWNEKVMLKKIEHMRMKRIEQEI